MKLTNLIISLLFVFILSSCQDENTRVIPSSSARVTAGIDQPNDAAAAAEAEQAAQEEENQDEADVNENEVEVADITYAAAVAPVIQDACNGCHNAAGQAAFLPLDTQDALEAALGADPDPASNLFLGRINDDVAPMPPNAERQVRDDLIKLLNGWQANNFL